MNRRFTTASAPISSAFAIILFNAIALAHHLRIFRYFATGDMPKFRGYIFPEMLQKEWELLSQ